MGTTRKTWSIDLSYGRENEGKSIIYSHQSTIFHVVLSNTRIGKTHTHDWTWDFNGKTTSESKSLEKPTRKKFSLKFSDSN